MKVFWIGKCIHVVSEVYLKFKYWLFCRQSCLFEIKTQRLLPQVQRRLSASFKRSPKSHSVQIQSGSAGGARWWNSGWRRKNNSPSIKRHGVCFESCSFFLEVSGQTRWCVPASCQTCSPQQQTEWQRYLRQSLEVVAKVMELLPSHAFTTLVGDHHCPPFFWPCDRNSRSVEFKWWNDVIFFLLFSEVSSPPRKLGCLHGPAAVHCHHRHQ